MSKNFNSMHFSDYEFQCKCKKCPHVVPNSELRLLLELVRRHFNKPVIITSGVRCVEYNRRVGGRIRSKHLEGLAADIVVDGVPPSDVYDYLAMTFPNVYGFGHYPTFTHVDVRKGFWRG